MTTFPIITNGVPRDRSSRSCVPNAVPRACFAALLGALLASGGSVVVVVVGTGCGGSGAKAKQDPTTPESSGEVTYGTLPDKDSKAGTDKPALPDPSDAVAEAPAEQPEAEPAVPVEPPKPPGEDLSDEEKQQRVTRHLAEARQHLRQKNADGMISAALATLDVDQTSVEAMILLGHGYFLKGWDDKSRAVLEEALRRQPDLAGNDAKLWMIFGLLMSRAGREEESLQLYGRATEKNPDYTEAWINRGVIYLRRNAFLYVENGETIGALPSFERANGLQLGAAMTDDDRAGCRCKQAATCAHLGAAYRGVSSLSGQPRDELLVRAERCFKNAMTVRSDYAPAYYDAGLLYLDAEPYPGLEKKPRLERAMTYLKRYRELAGITTDAALVARADEYLVTAQKEWDKEDKLEKRKKERDEKKRQRELKDQEKARAKAAETAPEPSGDEPAPAPEGTVQ